LSTTGSVPQLGVEGAGGSVAGAWVAGAAVAGAAVAGAAVAGAAVAGAAVFTGAPHAESSMPHMTTRASNCKVIFFMIFSFLLYVMSIS
jgi:hypothetical protein